MDKEVQEKLDAINKKLDYILLAFPVGKDGNPDPMAHRIYHEEENQYLMDRRKLREQLKSTVLSGAIWGFVAFAAASWSSVMRGGAFANNTNNYSLVGANYVRCVMNDAGALIDAG